MQNTITLTALFTEGLLSFFSPCVLPVIPLLIGYLMMGDREETRGKRRIQTFISVLFFVLGICSVYFLMALGAQAIGGLLGSYANVLRIIGGILLIVMGLWSIGFIQIPALEKEYRFESKGGQVKNVGESFLMGFFFSFAWTPCNGPLLASAILMASTAGTKALGFAYLGVYCLGFVIMFLLLGLFTEEVLSLLKKHQSVVRWTQKIGGVILIAMGAYMLLRGTVSSNNTQNTQNVTTSQETELAQHSFTLPNQNGEMVSLTDYQGKTVVVNFFGTWCYYCNQFLPTLQEVHDTYDDVQVLLIAAPNLGSEGDIEYINDYMTSAGYDFDILFDTEYEMTQHYGINGYPMTFIFKPNGDSYGYVPGYTTREQFLYFIEQAGIE